MDEHRVRTSLPPPAGSAVPQRPDEMTPAWLTACLRHAGALGDGEVRCIRTERVGEGKGFAGHLVRLTLEYDRPVPESPTRVIAKFASEHGDISG